MDRIEEQNNEPVHYLHRGAGRLRGWIFCFAVFACPLVYSFQFTSFLHPKEILLLICLLGMGLCVLAELWKGEKTKLQKSFQWNLIENALLLYVIFQPGSQEKAYSWNGISLLFILLMLNFCTHDLFSNTLWFRRIWTTAIFSGIGVALLALGQYAGLLEFMFPVFSSYTQPMYSVFGNQDLLGCYLAIILPMLLHCILKLEIKRSLQVLSWIGFFLLGMALILSTSRSAWLAATIGCSLMLWHHRGLLHLRKNCLPLIVVVLLLSLINAPLLQERISMTFSIGDVGGRARLWFWDGALRMIADHPWVGVGLGNYKYWSPYYQGLALHAPGGVNLFHNTLWADHAHNEFLEFIAETGLIGTMFFVAFVYTLSRFRGVAWIPLITLVIGSLFNALLHSVAHLLLGYIFCASLCFSKKAANSEFPALDQFRPFSEYGLVLFSILALSLQPVIYWSSYAQAQAERAHIAGSTNVLSVYKNAISKSVIPNYTLFESYGIALLEANRPDEALCYFERAKEGLDTGRIYYLLGTASAELGDKEKAIGYYREALFRWPSDQQTFDALLSLLSGEEHEAMREHAKRFSVVFPGK